MTIETLHPLAGSHQIEYCKEISWYTPSQDRNFKGNFFYGLNLADLWPIPVRRAALNTFAEQLSLDWPFVNTLKSVRLTYSQGELMEKINKVAIIIAGVWVPVSYNIPTNPGDGSRIIHEVVSVRIKPYAVFSEEDFELTGITRKEHVIDFKTSKGRLPDENYPYSQILLRRSESVPR